MGTRRDGSAGGNAAAVNSAVVARLPLHVLCPRPDLRPRHHRRRHQRRGDRARRRGPRAARAAGRAGRHRGRHVAVEHQADPRRPALSRAIRVPPGARIARRARGPAALRAASRAAARVRAAARAAPAAGLDDPRRDVPLRSPRPARNPARLVRRRSARRQVGRRTEAAFPQGLRLRRRARRRCAPGRAERDGGARAGAPTSACAPGSRRRSAKTGIGAPRWPTPRGRARGGHRESDRQRHRPVGQAGARHDQPFAGARERAPRQGQPHRGAARACRGARLHPAERGQPHRVRDPVPRPLFADRHDRRRRSTPSKRRGSPTTRSRTCSRWPTPISRGRSPPRTSCGRSAACGRSTTTAPRILRRSRATTCSRSTPAPERRRAGRRAGAVDLRRQAHHLSQARRARAVRAAAVPAADGAGMDARAAAARRRSAAGRARRLDRRAGATLSARCPSRCCADWRTGTARLPRRSCGRRRPSPTSARISAKG